MSAVARRLTLFTLIALGLLAGLFAGTASAATEARGKEQRQLLKAAMASPGGKGVRLQTNAKGRVTVAVLHPAPGGPAKIVAARSSVDPRWALLVAMQNGSPAQRMTFLLKRTAGRWKVQWSATRGYESDQVCRHRRPGTAVILDLGLTSYNWGEKCRYERKRAGLVRRMTAGEVNSIRRMVEWTWGDNGLQPGPVQPRIRDEFASDCAWDDRRSFGEKPVGEVARSNPSWGLLSITCVTGSDGFTELASTTVMLVRRAGRSGPFTQVLAHTGPSWSLRATLCDKNRAWPIPARPRVALEFCTPFPTKIRDALL